MSIEAQTAARHHAERARALANEADGWREENLVEAVEIAAIATAHSQAAIATILAEGDVSTETEVNPR